MVCSFPFDGRWSAYSKGGATATHILLIEPVSTVTAVGSMLDSSATVVAQQSPQVATQSPARSLLGSRSSGLPVMPYASRSRRSTPNGSPKASSGHSLIQRLTICPRSAISHASPSFCSPWKRVGLCRTARSTLGIARRRALSAADRAGRSTVRRPGSTPAWVG